jgi:thioredoxin-like negative regulator of GroEL
MGPTEFLPEPAPPPDELDRATATTTNDVPQLLFFYRADEGAGRRVEGFLAQVLQRRRNHSSFAVVRIDVNLRDDLAERFRISETPAVLVVVEGKVRARFARPKGCAEIQERLEPWLR